MAQDIHLKNKHYIEKTPTIKPPSERDRGTLLKLLKSLAHFNYLLMDKTKEISTAIVPFRKTLRLSDRVLVRTPDG